jgi:hypothetical protein
LIQNTYKRKQKIKGKRIKPCVGRRITFRPTEPFQRARSPSSFPRHSSFHCRMGPACQSLGSHARVRLGASLSLALRNLLEGPTGHPITNVAHTPVSLAVPCAVGWTRAVSGHSNHLADYGGCTPTTRSSVAPRSARPRAHLGRIVADSLLASSC